MKAFFILLTIVLLSTYVKGQQKDIFKNKPWEDFKKKELLTEKLKQASGSIGNQNLLQLVPQIAENESVLKIQLQHTYIGNTGKSSDIYIMNLDKMICLAPDKTFTSNMPVAGFDESIKSELLTPEKTKEK